MKLNSFFMVVMTLAVSASMTLASVWTPPDNPNVDTILKEAIQDAQAKRYEIALAKHVWFHENALKFDQAMLGVRLSFALVLWKNLGQEYPPALEKLRQIRDQLAAKANEAKKGIDIKTVFDDLASINRTLEEDSKTTQAFKSLIAKNPKAGNVVLDSAMPALIKDKEYALCAKYVDAYQYYMHKKRVYEGIQKTSKNRNLDPKISEDSTKSFRNDVATLVAILSLNDRKPQAAQIAALAKKDLEDAQFHKELEAALQGTVPTP